VIPGNTSSQGKFVTQPTSVSASSGNGEATVSFTLPTRVGKGTATYLVTASPGGATASGASSPITITGLSNGTAYTFTVTTVSNYGVTKASSASNSVTPVAPPYFPPFFPPFFPPAFNPCAGCPAINSIYFGQNCNGGLLQQVYSDGCCGQYAASSAYVNGYCGVTCPECDGSPCCSPPNSCVEDVAGGLGYYNCL